MSSMTTLGTKSKKPDSWHQIVPHAATLCLKWETKCHKEFFSTFVEFKQWCQCGGSVTGFDWKRTIPERRISISIKFHWHHENYGSLLNQKIWVQSQVLVEHILVDDNLQQWIKWDGDMGLRPLVASVGNTTLSPTMEVEKIDSWNWSKVFKLMICRFSGRVNW